MFETSEEQQFRPITGRSDVKRPVKTINNEFIDDDFEFNYAKKTKTEEHANVNKNPTNKSKPGRKKKTTENKDTFAKKVETQTNAPKKRGRPKKTEKLEITKKANKTVIKTKMFDDILLTSSNIGEESLTEFEKSIFVNEIDLKKEPVQENIFEKLKDIPARDINEFLSKVVKIIGKDTQTLKIIANNAQKGQFILSKENKAINFYEHKTRECLKQIEKWEKVKETLDKEIEDIKHTIDINNMEKGENKDIQTKAIKKLEASNAKLQIDLTTKADEMKWQEDKLLNRFDQLQVYANKIIKNIFEETEDDQINPIILLKAMAYYKTH